MEPRSNVKVYSNVVDFLEWINDVRNKKKHSNKELKELSEYFIAYCTHIHSTDENDTSEYRKAWYKKAKYNIYEESLNQSGF